MTCPPGGRIGSKVAHGIIEKWNFGDQMQKQLSIYFLSVSANPIKTDVFSTDPAIPVPHHSNAPMARIYGTANLLRPGIEDHVSKIGIDALHKAITRPACDRTAFFNFQRTIHGPE